ncbi:uncharacterized protein BJ171DRAFT_582599 [Polychytrium aggregatum]|uniref:uncharacterized protein n=1 Tax=Polychytrium aggregatum TaxID=110093 RepID=UPI0022FE3124|nr:uncharacterized protein BJ171DRAFT_582599 [Polychytrium aggregatum]KAI9203831.1 hypothetical protein BJ171DRAFT_582599 [Polychytrium aggregatum]
MRNLATSLRRRPGDPFAVRDGSELLHPRAVPASDYDDAGELVPRTKPGIVVHGHIIPSFSRRVDLTQSLQGIKGIKGISADALDAECKAWIRNIDVLFTAGCIASHSYESEQTLPVRINVFPPASETFPKRHVVTLASPTTDIFFHWTLEMTPFSFRTYIQSQGWRLDPHEMEEAFDGFGETICDRVRECLVCPKRFGVYLQINNVDRTATLTFFEVVLEYRRIKLMSVDFRETDWENISADIRYDYDRIKNHNSLLRTSLVQTVDLVSKHHPELLILAACDEEPVPVRQAHTWIELTQSLLSPRVQKGLYENGRPAAAGRILSMEERNMRLKLFLMVTEPREDDVEAIYSKSAECKVHGEGEPVRERLGESRESAVYFLTITKSDDIFFHFTSQDITRNKFLDLTKRLKVLRGSDADTSPSDEPFRHCRKTKEGDAAKCETLGFHPDEGIGGVLGVIAGDCLSGLEEAPDRYESEFDIQHVPRVHAEQETFGWKRPDPNPPQPRRAVLRFSEQVLFTTTTLLELEFTETCVESLKEQTEVDATQARLDLLCGVIRRRNPTLAILLNKIPVPPTFTKIPASLQSVSASMSMPTPGAKMSALGGKGSTRLPSPERIRRDHWDDAPAHPILMHPTRIPIQLKDILRPPRRRGVSRAATTRATSDYRHHWKREEVGLSSYPLSYGDMGVGGSILRSSVDPTRRTDHRRGRKKPPKVVQIQEPVPGAHETKKAPSSPSLVSRVSRPLSALSETMESVDRRPKPEIGSERTASPPRFP